MSADAQTFKNDTKSTTVNPEQGTPVDKEKGSPFGGAKAGKAAQDNSGPGNAVSPVNPFAEILKSGAEGRTPSNLGNAPGTLPFNLPVGNP
jgi:hypothetical protein